MKIRVTSQLKIDYSLGKKTFKSIDRAVSQGMRDVLFVAKELVPLDTGDLRSTGRFKKEEKDGVYQYAIEFGGQTSRASSAGAVVDYAYDQHETNYHHDNGRQWHYLTEPFEQMQGGLHERVKAQIKKDIK